MYGDEELGRNARARHEDILGLISARLVREGAEVLNGLDATALFVKDGGWEEHHLRDFLHWRQLFQDAAAQGDVRAGRRLLTRMVTEYVTPCSAEKLRNFICSL